MSVSAIYGELAEEAAGRTLTRRVSTSFGFEMFVTVSGPDSVRSIEAASPSPVYDDDLPRFHGLKAFVLQEPSGSKVVLQAGSPDYNVLFTIVAQDMAEEASSAATAAEAATRFIARLHSWQRFFREFPESGLSRERQQGLFGELVFLGDHVLDGGGSVTSWAAGQPSARDFSFGSWAVEVKTSAAKQPQNMSISNELQLDDRGLEALFLWHVSVDRAEGQGVSLPQQVAAVRNTVQESQRNQFEVRLLEAGYMDEHAGRYVDGYIERERRLYRVRDGFPRIIESDLPAGVGNVRYSIVADQCEPFSAPLEEIGRRLQS